MIPLKTDRLLLREWRESDKPAFARMNADLRVMEFFPAPLTGAESDQLFEKIQSHLRQRGFGLYAADCSGRAPFSDLSAWPSLASKPDSLPVWR